MAAARMSSTRPRVLRGACAGLLLVAALGAVAAADPQAVTGQGAAVGACPRGAVVRSARLPGSYEVQLQTSSPVQLRDVFSVSRGGAVLGEVMVIEQAKGRLVVVPRPSCKADLKAGDTVEFVRHALAPREASRAPQAALLPSVQTPPQRGADLSAPMQHTPQVAVRRLDSGSGSIAVTRMGFIQNKSTKYGKEFTGDVEIVNLSQEPVDGVVVTLFVTNEDPDRRTLGTVQPGARQLVEFARQRTKWEDTPEVYAEVEYLDHGTLQRTRVHPQKHAPGTPGQGGGGGY